MSIDLATLVRTLFGSRSARCEPLIPFTHVDACLRSLGPQTPRVQDVPIERIVGSVGRAHEYDRCFVSHLGTTARWKSIAKLRRSGRDLPPVILYRLGPAHFVVDGHHRISVARAREQDTIPSIVIGFEVSEACSGLGPRFESEPLLAPMA